MNAALGSIGAGIAFAMFGRDPSFPHCAFGGAAFGAALGLTAPVIKLRAVEATG